MGPIFSVADIFCIIGRRQEKEKRFLSHVENQFEKSSQRRFVSLSLFLTHACTLSRTPSYVHTHSLTHLVGYTWFSFGRFRKRTPPPRKLCFDLSFERLSLKLDSDSDLSLMERNGENLWSVSNQKWIILIFQSNYSSVQGVIMN